MAMIRRTLTAGVMAAAAAAFAPLPSANAEEYSVLITRLDVVPNIVWTLGADGATVTGDEVDGGDLTAWYWDVDGGTLVNNGICVEAAAGLTMAVCDGSLTQRWSTIPSIDGTVQWRNAAVAGHCVTYQGPGVQLALEPCDFQRSEQNWSIIRAD